MKKVGHNTGSTQKPECFCESIKGPMKPKNQNNHNLKIKREYMSNEKRLKKVGHNRWPTPKKRLTHQEKQNLTQ